MWFYPWCLALSELLGSGSISGSSPSCSWSFVPWPPTSAIRLPGACFEWATRSGWPQPSPVWPLSSSRSGVPSARSIWSDWRSILPPSWGSDSGGRWSASSFRSRCYWASSSPIEPSL